MSIDEQWTVITATGIPFAVITVFIPTTPFEISTPPKVVVLPSNVKEGKSAVGTYVVFTFTSSTMKP